MTPKRLNTSLQETNFEQGMSNFECRGTSCRIGYRTSKFGIPCSIFIILFSLAFDSCRLLSQGYQLSRSHGLAFAMTHDQSVAGQLPAQEIGQSAAGHAIGGGLNLGREGRGSIVTAF